MADPMSPAKMLAALRAEGATVVEVGGWEHHNRNHMGPWGPVHGVMIHHTVTKGSAATVRICRDGYAGLPGPLCHGVITKDGRIHLVGYGRANHAGLGDGDVLQAVIAERALPVDDEASVDGNRHFYGFECENLGDGVDPWPEAQLEAIERAAAAICRHHGWTAASVIRHLDWQPGKVDPRGIDWKAMRARIAERLGTPPPRSTPAPSTPTVSLKRLRAAAVSDPKKPGTPVSYGGTKTVEAALVDRGLLAKPYLDGHFGTATVRAYAGWQRSKAGGGYRGSDADGIPGRDSLRRLGLKAGFKVVD
ncbi:N-acetylmuramoyl-L-alanine amidase [Streptomyces sp. TRM68416]|uniref:N-acetylmuramoyl-L-alanine amidase n=1 Tax=Streptomyces sp. TRM68416 TaxID=2758412 RepID=UPI001661E61A|nr:N-acetylmuramoyl-L-alanine amidase [Streptomyces sp. TRM68416]MBD0837360.1 N-acetylmuramoyl-L-alanine amidase [Streptomyces sp. TRM68416]